MENKTVLYIVLVAVILAAIAIYFWGGKKDTNGTIDTGNPPPPPPPPHGGNADTRIYHHGGVINSEVVTTDYQRSGSAPATYCVPRQPGINCQSRINYLGSWYILDVTASTKNTCCYKILK